MVENTDIGGNTVDSPTTDGTDQATSTTDKVLDAADTAPTDQSGQKAVDSQAADTSKGDVEGTDTVDTDLPAKDTLPFDQHPKWQSARAAEKRVQEMLDEHGYDSIEDLQAAAVERDSLKALIGDRDAEQIVADFEEFQNVKKFWAENEAAKREADEDPADTVVRLKQEHQATLDKIQHDKDTKAAIEQSQHVLEAFDNHIRTSVNSMPDVSDTEKSLLTEFLGVDNEIAAVDPTDKVAVKTALSAGMQRFNTLVSDMKQQAIDDYVKGKSETTTIGASDTSAGAESVTTERKPLPKGTTIEAFGKAKREQLLERLTKAANA